MTNTKACRLRKFFSVFSGSDTVLVLINADPDAIASAMAVKRLLWRKVSSVSISNINVIERPDNQAMVKRLGVSMTHASQIRFSDYTKTVIVDSQPDHHDCFAMVRPDVIIDHHPKTCAVGTFNDIRPEYGATASIMTEYLKTARIKPSIKLATGLFHAIKTDTGNFERSTTSADLRAFQYLHKFTNQHLARKFEYAEIAAPYLKYFTKAINTRTFSKGRAFSHMGLVSSPDICVLIADFFMKVDIISWSFVSCLFEERLVIIIRNDGFYKSAGKLASQAFGKIGSAGGHKTMARAEIPVKELPKSLDITHGKQVERWIKTQIEKSK